jgi:integrase/recombinase XerC
LRHQAITAALDAGRDVRDVRKFSRHAKLETVLIYEDNRADVAGDVASLVAGE